MNDYLILPANWDEGDSCPLCGSYMDYKEGDGWTCDRNDHHWFLQNTEEIEVESPLKARKD